jgi:hypothetical protein
VHRRPTLRLVLAALGVAGLVASFAMLAAAAPNVAHRGASAAVYCVKSEKSNRKQQLDQAKSASADAGAAATTANALVTRLRKSYDALVVSQAKAKKTYWKTHRAAKARATFLAAQKKALTKAKTSLTAALRTSAAAQQAAASARTAQVTAQAAYDQCS